MIPKRLHIIISDLKTAQWMQTLLKEGDIYIVGGTVRDAYRDKDIKDIDIVAQGLNMAKIKALLTPFGRIDEVGESFAVLKFMPEGYEGEAFDIAVPRLDTKTGEGHKGFEVQTEGVDLLDDLRRRDFTINAIAINIATEELIDPFNGVVDIENEILKAVDDSAFAEDPLRILRGIQFAARFEYEIDLSTLILMKKYSHLVKEIKGERIFDELMKIINKRGDTQVAMDLLYKTDIDRALFGKKMLFYELGLGYLDVISFFWVLGILGDVDPADFIRNRLKGDNKLIKNVKTLDQMFELLPKMKEKEDLLFMLSKAFTKAPDIMDADIIPYEVKDVISTMERQEIPIGMMDVSVNGDDIIEIDPSIKGEAIGFILEKILRDALMNRFDWKDREKSREYLAVLLYK